MAEFGYLRDDRGIAADEPIVRSLVVPAATGEAGAVVAVQLATLNRSTSPSRFVAPNPVHTTLIISGERLPVSLQRRSAEPPTDSSIPPSGFVLDDYTLTIPTAARPGLATLEVVLADGGVVRGVIEVSSATPVTRVSAPSGTQRPTTNLVRVEPAANALRRTFAERLAPHEPIYFVYGADNPVAKFQVSFKYKILDFSEIASQRMVRSLHVAFTQRSLWDITGESSPFYDTSYMPEVMYQSLAPMPEKIDGNFLWLGFQGAFKHESNGRGGPQTRSLNVVYGRTAFAFGRLEGWHLLAVPEVFAYVGSLDENPDIADYRGYGKLSLILGRNDGPSLSATVWAGKDFNHVSTQLDLTLPVRTQLLKFETYFLIQYFGGYGESLLSYRTRSETVRAGISLVR